MAVPAGVADDESSAGDRALPDDPGAALEVVEERVDLGIGTFSFDVAKIRTRKASLFPFLTLDLLFLNDITANADDDKPSQGELANPYTAAHAPKSEESGALSTAYERDGGCSPTSACGNSATRVTRSESGCGRALGEAHDGSIEEDGGLQTAFDASTGKYLKGTMFEARPLLNVILSYRSH